MEPGGAEPSEELEKNEEGGFVSSKEWEKEFEQVLLDRIDGWKKGEIKEESKGGRRASVAKEFQEFEVEDRERRFHLSEVALMESYDGRESNVTKRGEDARRNSGTIDNGCSWAKGNISDKCPTAITEEEGQDCTDKDADIRALWTRAQVAKELVRTEEDYLNNLESIILVSINTFLLLLLSQRESRDIKDSTSSIR